MKGVEASQVQTKIKYIYFMAQSQKYKEKADSIMLPHLLTKYKEAADSVMLHRIIHPSMLFV